MKRLFLVRRIVGDSMSPTFHNGQIIVLSGLSRVSVGSVVLVAHGGLEKVKRVYAITSAGIELRGDNETKSIDSRQFGSVPQAAVIGVVVWPRLSRKR